VRAADLFGSSLQVRFDARGTDADSIERALQKHGAQTVRKEQVEATLEDVFLAVVSRKEQKGEAA
jgi:hypothetical protein